MLKNNYSVSVFKALPLCKYYAKANKEDANNIILSSKPVNLLYWLTTHFFRIYKY